MSIRFKNFLLVLSSWAIIQACDPCDDCGVVLEYNPSVDFIFINIDSVSKLEDSIEINDLVIDSLSEILETFTDSINSLGDSLNALEVGIDSGNLDLEPALTQITALITATEAQLKVYSDEEELTDSLNTVMNDLVATINSGLIKPDEITLINLNQTFDYEDSATSFTLPIVMRENSSSYEITINGNTYQATLSYETEIELNLRQEAVAVATGISPSSDLFDSLNYECLSSRCINNEVSITFYF